MRGHPDGRGCPDAINLISKAFLPVLVFIESEFTTVAHDTQQRKTERPRERGKFVVCPDNSTVWTPLHLYSYLTTLKYLWPEAVWTWANQHIISLVSKCIIAKISCDLRPGDQLKPGQLARSKVGVK